MNIIEIASASDDFNLLMRALDAASLVTTVQEMTDLTVFAPTDAAFTQLAVNLGFDGDPTDEDAVYDAIVAALTELSDGDPLPLLTDILLFHVAPGARTEPTIAGSDSIATLLDRVNIMPMDGVLGDAEPDLPDPIIMTEDIMADNGIIQVIDRVLLPIDIPGNEVADGPLSIAGLVANGGSTAFDQPGEEFDILLAAVQAAGLTDTLDAVDADLTVFAPNDAAFVGFAQTLGFDGTDEASAFDFIVRAFTLLSNGGDPIPLLTDILTYHVSPGAKDSTAVTSATTLSTLLEGATIGVEGTSLVDNDPDIANPDLVSLDVQTSNGILHVLDGVLIPIDILPSNGSDLVEFVFGDDADDTFVLGPDNDFIDAGGGDDTIDGGGGRNVIIGGDGIDTAIFSSDLSQYSIVIDQDGTTISERSGFSGSGGGPLKEVELLQFADGASFAADGFVDLSILEGAASISGNDLDALTELYVAYFDRAPDAFGLLFWANAFEQGVTLNEVAELFFDQPETQAKLPDTLTSGEFVDLAFNHVLERDADAEGHEFWSTQLDDGTVSRAEFMLELVKGARANDAAADDVRTIEDKTDIGLSFAGFYGLNDAPLAQTVMDVYERDNAESSLAEAQYLIEEFASYASGVADGSEITVQIVGLVDDPFATPSAA